MIINIDNKKYRLLDNINEMTLQQFIQISKIKFENDIQYNTEILSILSDIPVEEIEVIASMTEFSVISNHFNNILAQTNLNIEEISEVKIGTNTYNIVENDDFKVKHWLDLQMLEESTLDNLHKIIATTLTPSDKYDIKTIDLLADEILYLPVNKIYGIYLTYLKKKLKL